MSVAPGNDGADCKRCGGPTTQIGCDGGVYGVVCENCDLVTVLPGHDTHGGDSHVTEEDFE
jgi:hypothetical protein